MKIDTKAFKKADFYTGLGIFAGFIWFIQNTTGLYRLIFTIAAIADAVFLYRRIFK